MNLPKLIFPLIIITIGLLAPFSSKGDATIDAARQIIQFRQIGHEFLLSLGDNASTIPPVKKISDVEYRLEFKKPFAFMPDSLVNTVGRIMKRSAWPADYVITVTDQETQQVAYGFTTKDLKNGVVPCIGRALPMKNYAINIFIPVAPKIFGLERASVYASTIIGLLVISLVIVGWFTKNKIGSAASNRAGVKNNTVGSKSISIGKYLFYPEEQLLVCNNEHTLLTAKERKLLSIFTARLNQVIDRNSLLKEGWEDEGVITGRSLDMYVSKLRKKLQKDTSVSILNVHGRGYSLNAR